MFHCVNPASLTKGFKLLWKLFIANGKPVRLLTLGIMLNLILLPTVAGLVWSMYCSLSTIGNEEMLLQRLVGRIAYLNEVLTDSARMAAATSDPIWEKRYREVEPKLDSSIVEVAMLARKEYEKNYAAQTKMAYLKLIEMEDLAMTLARRGRLKEATEILFSDHYARQKAKYSEGLNNMNDAIQIRISKEMALHEARLWQTGIAGIIALLVLLAAWIGVSLSIKRHLIQRNKAERALAQEKERLTVTLRSISEGVITADTKHRVTTMNQVAEELTGWNQEDAVGKKLDRILGIVKDHESYDPSITAINMRLYSASQNQYFESAVLRAKDGTDRLIEHSTAPILTTNKRVIGIVVVFRDVTHQRKIQQELVKAEKLESIGLLAGGIAHDFNNLLTGIMGNISLAKMHIEPDGKAYNRLTEAEEASSRASGLTHQLLTFSKGGAPVKHTVQLKDLLVSWCGFALHGSNVGFRVEIDSDSLWAVDIDEGQISQVINNLVINADQAMPEGGTIHVSASNVVIKEEGNIPLRPGRYVQITICDQGIGIPRENLSKIFDPYFTTKLNGVGLGLSTSFASVKRHGGYVTVESKEGVGTLFTLYLPASDSPYVGSRKEDDKPVNGSGKILIMDDEEIVRDLAAETLSLLGYRVKAVNNGNDAIYTYKQSIELGDPFDVVIMDLSIPGGKGGKETIYELREIDPKVKAIVSSGYSDDTIMSEHYGYGFCGVLTKPYTAHEMSRVVHEAMMSKESEKPEQEDVKKRAELVMAAALGN